MRKEQEHAKVAKRCNYCGSPAAVVWVHGHGQCANCGINIEECCRGEQNEMKYVPSEKS